MSAREVLIGELREHALVIGDVVLTSGRRASYYIDAKRAILLPAGFAALAQLLAAQARDWGATAVGGLTMGATLPPVRPSRAVPTARRSLSVRKSRSTVSAAASRGRCSSRRIAAWSSRTSSRPGGSTIAAIEALRAEGHTICGVVTILDRLMGGREAIEAATDAPYSALTTIDDVYPDRPQ